MKNAVHKPILAGGDPVGHPSTECVTVPPFLCSWILRDAKKVQIVPNPLGH